eukprot:Nk52_evm1s328 gene=Nk52_evmTU1s328
MVWIIFIFWILLLDVQAGIAKTTHQVGMESKVGVGSLLDHGCVREGDKLVCQMVKGEGTPLGDLGMYSFDCAGLSVISLVNMGITNIPNNYFADCSAKLQTLEIVGNEELTTVSDGAFNGLNLQVLRLSQNNKLSQLPSPFLNSSVLSTLDLHGNGITELDKPLFVGEGTNEQVKIDLSHNAIRKFYPSKIIREESLYYVFRLCLNDNQIDDIEPSSQWPSSLLDKEKSIFGGVRVFNISNNKLKSMKFAYEGELSLNTAMCPSQNEQCALDLSNNEIQSSQLDLQMYQGLYTLILSGNEDIYSLPPITIPSPIPGLVLERTNNLHELPIMSAGQSKIEFMLGEDLSCCAIGQTITEIGDIIPARNPFTCLLNGERKSFKSLIEFSNTPMNCGDCRVANCNMDAAVKPQCTKQSPSTSQIYYHVCECSVQGKCYVDRSFPSASNDKADSSTAFNSKTTYILIGSGICTTLVAASVGTVCWLRKRKQKTDEGIQSKLQRASEPEQGNSSFLSDKPNETFDEPMELSERIEQLSYQGIDYPERLGVIEDRAHFVEVDCEGRLIVQTGSEPPELPPQRNEFLTALNLKYISKVNIKRRVDTYASEVSIFMNQTDDVCDPVTMQYTTFKPTEPIMRSEVRYSAQEVPTKASICSTSSRSLKEEAPAMVPEAESHYFRNVLSNTGEYIINDVAVPKSEASNILAVNSSPSFAGASFNHTPSLATSITVPFNQSQPVESMSCSNSVVKEDHSYLSPNQDHSSYLVTLAMEK